MTSTEKPIPFKKEKEISQAIDAQLKELNQTFKEQSKCLEDRAATQMAVLEMAHDFLRKWADIETEHSQKMEKLVKSFANKEKSGNNGNISISVCLLGLFSTCGKLGKMYQQLSDTITSQVTDRLQVARDDSQLVRKQCGPVLEQSQDSIRKSCQDVINTVKPYHTASSAFATADQQLKDAQVEMNKVQQPQSNGSSKTGVELVSKPQVKKQASVERKVADRHSKRESSLAKVNDERNRHITSLSCANAALNCYNTEILPKYIRAMDYCARPAICLTLTSLSKFMAEQAERAVIGVADELKSAVTRCQAENDVALMAHYAPKLFTSGNRSNTANNAFRFYPLRTDEPGELLMPIGIRDNRKLSLTNLNNENAKKLAAIVADLERWEQAKWQSQNGQAQQHTTPSLIDSGLGLGQVPPGTIELYAQTLKQYSEIAEQIARNDYELSLLNSSVAGVTTGYYAPQPNSSFSSPQRGYLYSAASTDSGRPSNDHAVSSSSVGSSSSGDNLNSAGVQNSAASRTPVFGGSIEDHLNRVGLNDSQNLRSNSATPGSISVNSVSSINSLTTSSNPPVPQVVVCCVQYLAKFGLRQQGVFRINGSQIEISELKSKFERCENPLQSADNASSVNAAASVLKSYFRQLREPLLLPSSSVTFDQWISVQNSPLGTVEAIRLLISKMPSQIRTVAAFLFVFLNRVAELSAENMMDAYNLAVCFAPCLLPCPNEAEQMQHFNALAAIIKAMIVNATSIFSSEDVHLYDEVINNKPLEKQAPDQVQPVVVQSLRGLRKPSITSSCDVPDNNNSDPNSTPAVSLTRQFRTLGNIETVAQSPTSVRSLITGGGGGGGDSNSISLLPDDAEAMFNFTARNGHEMSLRRGDRMRIVRKLSEQWWEVSMQGRSGLVPATYLRLLTPSPALLPAQHQPSTRTRSVADSQMISGADGEQANPLLNRQISTGNSVKIATSNGERRVFNNETNGTADPHGSVGSQQLWMRRQISTGDQQRKSDSAVVMGMNTVIETTIGTAVAVAGNNNNNNQPANGQTTTTPSSKPATMS